MVFSKDYFEAREKFREAACHPGQSFTCHQVHHLDKDKGLDVDVVRFGSLKARAVLIVSSGVHGAEGFAGSAIQTDTIANKHLGSLPEDMAVVYVHALNPYGFANLRRVNEDNVDLNRNFIDWDKLPPADHHLAAYMHRKLVPEKWENFEGNLVSILEEKGVSDFQAAITQGQYNFPDGLFYGGNGSVWSNRIWRNIVKEQASQARFIGHVDLHTGLGAYGHGEIIISGSSRSETGKRAKKWWGESVRSLADGTSVSADLSGCIELCFNSLADNRQITTAALEFGTLPVLDVLRTLAFDNWVHARCPDNTQYLEQAGAKMHAAFAPEDKAWQNMVLARGQEVLLQAKKGLEASLLPK
ncbi:MAG: DUF2817 domain-containing protein [Alphaproteobacteria bacterium CG_4_9_14_3_um_filter_47_13]|nr:MAG: DUF2817 domain-containing protein [Alphaproteobacteria bacterium CG_4_9_14_3_um_filter_47_13]